jgi:cell division protein FtsL
MKRPKRLISFIFLIILALSVVRVSIENNISTTGVELMSLQEKLETYKKENSQLEESYLASSSLTKISEIAQKKGFVESKNPVYFSTPLPLALKQ